jgi:hypothetical protein
MRSRNRKPPSLSSKLKLKKFRDRKDTVSRENRKMTQDEIKKLFKKWK